MDNIILLSYVEISTKLRRALLVPKVRGAAIPQTTREFLIEAGGIKIVEEDKVQAREYEEVPQLPLSSYYGILSRAPARQSPLLEGKIARGEAMPKSPRIR